MLKGVHKRKCHRKKGYIKNSEKSNYVYVHSEHPKLKEPFRSEIKNFVSTL